MNNRKRASPPTKHFMRGFYPGILDVGVTELRSLQSLLSRLPTFLTEEQADFACRLEQRVREEQMDEEQESGFYNAHEEKFHELHAFFPNALWHSLLTLACSLFESRLMEACKFLEKSFVHLHYTWANDKDRGVEKSAKFLRKNFDICPERHESWAKIRAFIDVRNCFVHANGDVELMREDQQSKIETSVERLREAGVTLSDIRTIQLTEMSVSAAVQHMEDWFRAFWTTSRENAKIGPCFWP